MVLSADPVTGEQSYQKVVRTFVKQADELFTITTEDGRSIEATGEHPFWVEGKGFIAAKRLARSDLLRDASGQAVRVARTSSRPGEFTVYNFEVENTHTYYAGDWWVHNNCGRPSGGSPALKGDPYHPASVEARIRPQYQTNPAHVPSSRTPFNPRKSPEPPDAEEVYLSAVRSGHGTWFGKGQQGWCRFFHDQVDSVHFSGLIDETQVPNAIRKEFK